MVETAELLFEWMSSRLGGIQETHLSAAGIVL